MNGEQFEIDFEKANKKLELTNAFIQLGQAIEGSVTEKHLQGLYEHKAVEVLGSITKTHEAIIETYLANKNIDDIDVPALVDALLEIHTSESGTKKQRSN